MRDEVMTGQKAFEEIKSELEGMTGLPNFRPRVDTVAVVEEVRRLILVLKVDLDVILAPFSPELKAELSGLIEGRLDLFGAALLHTAGQDKVFSAPRTLAALILEAKALREQGHIMMGVLKGIGLVSEDKIAKLRAGRGRRDLLSDLEVISSDGLKHWGILGPLQQHQAKPEKRLSRDKLQRMAALAQELTRHLDAGGAPQGEDWRRMFIASFAALDRIWNRVRACARCAYRLEGRDDKADALISLIGLGRR